MVAMINKYITVVTGIPRSGTSLMMQMLNAGGMSLLYDDQRSPDISNPKGYFELEQVKRIHEDHSWLSMAQGKVLKITIPLIFYLPESYSYKIIVMKRKLSEIIRSQTEMLSERKISSTDSENMKLMSIYRKQLFRMNYWIKEDPQRKAIEISYNELITDSKSITKELVEFLEFAADANKMTSVVHNDLYRQREM